MTSTFTITFDYLCPFARNVNESVIEALRAGSDWEVSFLPFSLAQTKVEEGDLDVWDRPPGADGTRGVTALQWGIAVRDEFADSFFDFHLALFDARHGRGADIGDESELRNVAESVDLDPDRLSAVVTSGRPRATLEVTHRRLVDEWGVFGVPTFIARAEAVFVRMMERHRPDEIERIVAMISWDNLNEFKRTRLPR